MCPICPKCKEKIIYFNVKEEIEGGLSYSLDGWDEEPNERERTLIFFCPECDYCFEDFDEEKATDFLNDDELQKIVKEKLNKIKEKNANMS